MQLNQFLGRLCLVIYLTTQALRVLLNPQPLHAALFLHVVPSHLMALFHEPASFEAVRLLGAVQIVLVVLYLCEK